MDFISLGMDYVDFIKSDEDLASFNRMKDLEQYMHKPIKECFNEVIEYSNLERKLRGLPPLKVTIQQPDKN